MEIKTLLFFLVFLCLISSCQHKMICPAFQSTYVLDDEKRATLFSLFAEDSIPKKKLIVKKNKYGIIVHLKYQKKQKNYNTVRMKNVLPEEEEVVALAEQDNAYDSISGDLQPKLDNRYNSDQILYMEFIGNQLLDAREKAFNAYEKKNKEQQDAQLLEDSLEPKKPSRKDRREEKRKLKEEQKNTPTHEQEEETEDDELGTGA